MPVASAAIRKSKAGGTAKVRRTRSVSGKALARILHTPILRRRRASVAWTELILALAARISPYPTQLNAW